MRSYWYYILFGGLLILCLFWLYKPMGEFLVGDASLFVILVHKVLGLNNSPLIDLVSGRDLWHPFLYPGLLIMTAKVFGPDLFYLRIVGLLCLVLNLLLLRKISHLLVKQQDEGRLVTFLACSLFLLQPYTLKGAVHLDIDNTILTPIILLFVYLFGQIGTAPNQQLRDTVLLSLTFSLGLCAKLTTPLLLPVAMAIVFMLKEERLRMAVYPTVVLFAGGGGFLLIWVVFCHTFGLPFSTIFSRIFLVLNHKVMNTSNSGILSFFRDFSLIVYWLNPLILFLWIVALFLTVKGFLCRQFINDLVLFIDVLAILIGLFYLFIGQTTFGVPKYHYPVIGLLSLSIAYRVYPWFAKLTTASLRWALLASCVLSLVYFLVEDPMYLLNYELKMAALVGDSLKPLVTRFAVISLAYLLPLLLVIGLFLFSKRKEAGIVLLISIMAQTVGLNFRQSLSHYQITYSYGYHGVNQVSQLLPKEGKILISEGSIVPPWGIVGQHELNLLNKSRRKWLEFVAVEKPDVVVCGPALNTLADMQEIFMHRDWRSLMYQHYSMISVEDYIVYLRK